MVNIIQQIIAAFPTSNITVNFNNGGTASGRPFAIVNNGVFELTNGAGAITDRINICSIAFISLTGEDTFTGFTFLPPPSPLPTDCAAQCEQAVRIVLQSFVGGANVNVRAGGSSTGSKSVTSTAFGVAILGNNTAVSTCAVENIT
ncbi:hypothetical protein PIPA1_34500 [Pelosinus sp. IPA-1]|nr:hypothetical protein PIPA1_34500 [Pelosinus sp. IPA-1]